MEAMKPMETDQFESLKERFRHVSQQLAEAVDGYPPACGSEFGDLFDRAIRSARRFVEGGDISPQRFKNAVPSGTFNHGPDRRLEELLMAGANLAEAVEGAWRHAALVNAGLKPRREQSPPPTCLPEVGQCLERVDENIREFRAVKEPGWTANNGAGA
jgi:hypothetical protein